jgi:hypothetical protein
MTASEAKASSWPPSGMRAIASALALAFLAKVLFDRAEAGPYSGVVLFAYPFVIGGLGFAAARDARRTWRVVNATGPEGGVNRGVQLTLALLALVLDSMLIGLAVLIAILILHGPIVA